MPTTLSVPGTESYRWKELMEGHLGDAMIVLNRVNRARRGLRAGGVANRRHRDVERAGR